MPLWPKYYGINGTIKVAVSLTSRWTYCFLSKSSNGITKVAMCLDLDHVVVQGRAAGNYRLVFVLDLEDLDRDSVLGPGGTLAELLGRVVDPIM